MTTNTADWAVIGFFRDYNNDEWREPWIYQITDGDVKTSKPVGVSNGKSVEFFLVKTVYKLEVVCEATAGGWTATQRFRELKECLRCDALESYNKLPQNNYPNPSGQDKHKLRRNCASHPYRFGKSPLSWEQGPPLHDKKGTLYELSSPEGPQIQIHRRSLLDVPVARIWEHYGRAARTMLTVP